MGLGTIRLLPPFGSNMRFRVATCYCGNSAVYPDYHNQSVTVRDLDTHTAPMGHEFSHFTKGTCEPSHFTKGKSEPSHCTKGQCEDWLHLPSDWLHPSADLLHLPVDWLHLPADWL